MIFHENDAIIESPPFPYLSWTEGAIKKKLRQLGFDFNKEIIKVISPTGVYFEQG
ncbi:hypothetical protein LCGC14_2403560 [marine sediment metagenome]|uniref:Uncharacterized protein n=1 Tax=marine sediment metagenome TaxID=412755 RepID=A0A0F9E6V1_9ZZZZ